MSDEQKNIFESLLSDWEKSQKYSHEFAQKTIDFWVNHCKKQAERYERTQNLIFLTGVSIGIMFGIILGFFL
jgi:uncharacterized membrane protein